MCALNTVFFGTSPLACPSLEALMATPGFRVLAVVTQPDRPAGRKLRLHPSAVKALGLKCGLPVLQPGRARDDSFLESFRTLGPDLAIVVAYGQILPRTLLDLVPMGFLNVHASLLPRYRGAAPIQWAVWNGDLETGVTIMKLDPGLDTGPILSQRSTSITDSDDAQTLHDRLAQIGAQLLIDTLPPYTAGQLLPRPQSQSEVSYARKITRDDARLDWSLPARQLWNQTRALVPWPATFTYLPQESKPLLLKIWETEWVPLATASHTPSAGRILELSPAGILVACGQDALRLRTVQPEGRRRMSAAEFLAGHSLCPGSHFESGENPGEQDASAISGPGR
jgi:methionyl-tRNA formyltransferase